MKVKVAFAGARLVIPCGNPKDKVERLVEAINARFRSHLGDPTLRVQELTTAEGFLINVQDTIEQVIDDGAQLHALDYATWLQATLPNLSRVHWVARSDYAEGCSRPPLRYAEVGKHALHSNKVYVKVGTRHYGEDKDPRLWLFDADSLSTFGQQQEERQRVLVAHAEAKDQTWDWWSHIYFIVEGGVVVAVELCVETASDARAQIEVVPIESSSLNLGTPIVKQTASMPRPEKTYVLPDVKTEGTSFKSEHLDQPKPTSHESTVPKNVAEGNLGLEIKQKELPQADQSSAVNGAYKNMLYNHLAIFNPLEEEVAVVKIKSEYEKEGNWIEMNTRLGTKSGRFSYSMGQHTDGFVVGKNQRLDLAVESSVLINAPQYDRQRRMHHSLPSPLRVRITVDDKKSKSSQIVIEHINEPLEIMTKEKRESSDQLKRDFWLHADDTEAEERVWCELVYVQNEKRLQISSKPADKQKWMYQSDLNYYIYLAKKDGKQEFEIEELTTKDEARGYSQRVVALVDVEQSWAYALRFELRTNLQCGWALPPA